MDAVIDSRSGGFWIIGLSFVAAMVLSVVSLSDDLPMELGYLRPQWVVLVLIYWVIALPHRIGVIFAWCLGLMMDVLLGTLLGQHGIAFILVAYIAQSLYQRLRMFAIWQQSLIVFGTVGVSELINYWIESIVGNAEWSLWQIMPAVMSAFLWPWIFLVLRFLRRYFNVT